MIFYIATSPDRWSGTIISIPSLQRQRYKFLDVSSLTNNVQCWCLDQYFVSSKSPLTGVTRATRFTCKKLAGATRQVQINATGRNKSLLALRSYSTVAFPRGSGSGRTTFNLHAWHVRARLSARYWLQKIRNSMEARGLEVRRSATQRTNERTNERTFSIDLRELNVCVRIRSASPPASCLPHRHLHCCLAPVPPGAINLFSLRLASDHVLARFPRSAGKIPVYPLDDRAWKRRKRKPTAIVQFREAKVSRSVNEFDCYWPTFHRFATDSWKWPTCDFFCNLRFVSRILNRFSRIYVLRVTFRWLIIS